MSRKREALISGAWMGLMGGAMLWALSGKLPEGFNSLLLFCLSLAGFILVPWKLFLPTIVPGFRGELSTGYKLTLWFTALEGYLAILALNVVILSLMGVYPFSL